MDAAREPRMLGVGISIVPHATRELVELGLPTNWRPTFLFPDSGLPTHGR